LHWLAAGAETVDRADPGHHQVAPLDREPRGASLELTPDDLREINASSAKITLQGARYPEHLQKLIGR